MRTIYWKNGAIEILDQSKLPRSVKYVRLNTLEEVVEAVRTMRVRGAPLIGVAAAFGLALVTTKSEAKSLRSLLKEIGDAAAILRSTRPTGSNLHWALKRLTDAAGKAKSVEELKRLITEEAIRMAEEDVKTNLELAEQGSRLIEDGDVILTHCNTGLGTVEHGTAIGVVKTAFRKGKKVSVIATETRPQLQGARLTTFELKLEGIPFKLITDGMVGFVMANGAVSKVIVGADRVLRDGHVINKIGTYPIAVLAKAHSIPFYVAAPLSTFDLKSKLKGVKIEFRDQKEVLAIGGRRIAYEGTEALNPAFDVTPPNYVTAIVTEKEIVYPPYEESVPSLFRKR